MNASNTPKVVVLAGGVGGARMALGFAHALPEADVSVVVNVGDDDDFHGLRVCPDLDTVLYTLSGRVDTSQGWGVAGDDTKALEVLRILSSPDSWMKLGDADLALHIFRTAELRRGQRLTQVMAQVATNFGLKCHLLPVSDDECPTLVETGHGVSKFQEWFVRDRGAPQVKRLLFDAAAKASITREVRNAIEAATLIVVAPSNPYLSVRPMLAVGDMAKVLQQARAPKVAVSPLIGGIAIKGPLVKLMQDLGMEPNGSAIAKQYTGVVDAFVIDESDATQASALRTLSGLEILSLPTLISDASLAARLAEALLEWGAANRSAEP